MWTFFNRILGWLLQDLNDRLDVIVQSQLKLEQMIMAIKDDVLALAAKMDQVTNEIASNVDVVKTKIEELQAQIASGTLTPAELSAAMDPIVGHLTTVSDNLKAVAQGGTPTVPPVEPL